MTQEEELRRRGRQLAVLPLALAIVMATALSAMLLGRDGLHRFGAPIVVGLASLVLLALWLAGPASERIICGQGTTWVQGALFAFTLLLVSSFAGTLYFQLVMARGGRGLDTIVMETCSTVFVCAIAGIIPSMIVGSIWAAILKPSFFW